MIAIYGVSIRTLSSCPCYDSISRLAVLTARRPKSFFSKILEVMKEQTLRCFARFVFPLVLEVKKVIILLLLLLAVEKVFGLFGSLGMNPQILGVFERTHTWLMYIIFVVSGMDFVLVLVRGASTHE